jgi:eukaryotic-like serine/threonine-protein kinase
MGSGARQPVEMRMTGNSRTTKATEATLLGRYHVYDRIAAGGMASVHLGRLAGRAGFSRLVAIKKLHDHVARDPKFVAMLLDEARLVALVRHPNVVSTLEIVEGADSLAVVMEYIPGESLDGLVDTLATRGERLPPAIAVSVVVHMLHGLHAAHEAVDASGRNLDIVHRDISPQNVLVGIDGLARVLDFGVARAATRLQGTETGELKGKVAYMSPEQLQETGVDRRSDLFAAGTVMWELLTGKPLFFGSSPVGTIGNVLNMAILPPSHAGSESAALDAVVMKSLERDRDKRFHTAEEMAVALEDAMPLAKQRDIGRWVSTVAEATLRSRAAIARRIENEDLGAMRSPTGSSPELSRVLAEVENRFVDVRSTLIDSPPVVDSYVDSEITERDPFTGNGDTSWHSVVSRPVVSTERVIGLSYTTPAQAGGDAPRLGPAPVPAASPRVAPDRLEDRDRPEDRRDSVKARSKLGPAVWIGVGAFTLLVFGLIVKAAITPRAQPSAHGVLPPPMESAPSSAASQPKLELLPLPSQAPDAVPSATAPNPSPSASTPPKPVEPRSTKRPKSDRQGE